MYNIAGLDVDSYGGDSQEVMFRIIHPDDVKAVRTLISDIVKKKETRPMEYRIIRPDGRMRYLRSASRFIMDDEGEPLACIGVHLDITEKNAMKTICRE